MPSVVLLLLHEHMIGYFTCQELPGDIGAALCELLDEGGDMNTNLLRYI